MQGVFNTWLWGGGDGFPSVLASVCAQRVGTQSNLISGREGPFAASVWPGQRGRAGGRPRRGDIAQVCHLERGNGTATQERPALGCLALGSRPPRPGAAQQRCLCRGSCVHVYPGSQRVPGVPLAGGLRSTLRALPRSPGGPRRVSCVGKDWKLCGR